MCVCVCVRACVRVCEYVCVYGTYACVDARTCHIHPHTQSVGHTPHTHIHHDIYAYALSFPPAGRENVFVIIYLVILVHFFIIYTLSFFTRAVTIWWRRVRQVQLPRPALSYKAFAACQGLRSGFRFTGQVQRTRVRQVQYPYSVLERVCERASERERERGREGGRERESAREKQTELSTNSSAFSTKARRASETERDKQTDRQRERERVR